MMSNIPKMRVGREGLREWWLKGKLHREDGPAVEMADGTREWYQNANGTRILYYKVKRLRQVSTLQ